MKCSAVGKYRNNKNTNKTPHMRLSEMVGHPGRNIGKVEPAVNMYSSNQFETSGDIRSIILWGTSILENSIHLPCHQNWWGCIVYRIHKLPYLEVKIPYKTRTTHVYSLLFFRNENLIQDDFPNATGDQIFSLAQGATNVSWLHNQWQPSLPEGPISEAHQIHTT